MRLPFFFTRATEITSVNDTTPLSGTGIWKIEFAFDNEQTATQTSSPTGTGWKQWGGNDLIGVYEGFCTNSSDNTSGNLLSISGKTPTPSIQTKNFIAKASNQGTGFSIVKWRHHCIMAILFYSYYGHTNCQALLGLGPSSATGTGSTNSYGMKDSTDNAGKNYTINFWGLENWWGNCSEFMTGISITRETWTVIDDSGNTRTVTGSSSYGAWYYPSKWVIGENLDIVPLPGQSGGNATSGYCDGVYVDSDNSARSVSRSRWTNQSQGGVGFIGAADHANYAANRIGSRLSYTGDIEIV